MRLEEEDIKGVMCNDLPRTEEYSFIIYASQNVGKLINDNSGYEKTKTFNDEAWSGIHNLMARCIARGIRLERERSEKFLKSLKDTK